MFGRWLSRLVGRRAAVPAAMLPSVEREEVEHLWRRPEGLPRVDWSMTDRWIDGAPGDRSREHWRRAIMAACLDELRDSLRHDHRRWRSANVEGLAPLDGLAGPAAAAAAERAFAGLKADLRPIRGTGPIPRIAIVLIEPVESYVDFTASYFPDEGAFATSGGLYLNEGTEAFPLIAVASSTRHAVPAVVVHELTHHALHGCGLPLWAEEGLTQMMEERHAGHVAFGLDRERIARQREHWGERGLGAFLDGSAFLSPTGDTQELAYALSQWVVRSELDRRPDRFFAFLAGCRGPGAESAALAALGVPMEKIVEEVLFGGAQ